MQTPEHVLVATPRRWSWIWCSIVLAPFPAGCGAGVVAVAGAVSDGGGGSTPFELISASPGVDESGVAPRAPVSLAFNEAVDPAAVRPDSVVVSDGARVVSGQISVVDSSIRWTPDCPLSFLAPCSVHVSGEIASASGKRLGTARQWEFTTRDGEWGPVEVLFADARAMALDDCSRITSAGTLPDPFTGLGIVGTRNEGAGWSLPERFDSGDLGFNDMDMEALPDGRVAFLYIESGFLQGGSYEPEARRWSVQGGMDPFGGLGNASSPRVSADRLGTSGRAIGAFAHGTAIGTTFDPSTGWSPGVILDGTDLSPEPGGLPEVAAFAGGGGIAVWKKPSAVTLSSSELWANECEPASDWTPARSSQVRDFGAEIEELYVVTAADRRALVVVSVDGFLFGLRWEGGVWSAPEIVMAPVLPQSLLGFSTAAVSMNAEGDALVVALVPGAISSRRLDPIEGWQAEVQVASTPDSIDSASRLGLDGAGRALLIWAEIRSFPHRFLVLASRQHPGSGWSDPFALTEFPGTSAPPLTLAMNVRGKAVAMWSDGVNNSFSRAFE